MREPERVRQRATTDEQEQEKGDTAGVSEDVTQLYGVGFKEMALAVSWRDAQKKQYSEADRYVDVESPDGDQMQTITIWVYKSIDQLRVHPVRIRRESSRFVLHLEDIVLLARSR